MSPCWQTRTPSTWPDRYYDEVPRASTTTEVIGPFTPFVRASEEGWPFYARPRLGYEGRFTTADVRRVRQRQLELGAPEAFEWVRENHPDLAAVFRDNGLPVAEHPLMVLGTLTVAAGSIPVPTASSARSRVRDRSVAGRTRRAARSPRSPESPSSRRPVAEA